MAFFIGTIFGLAIGWFTAELTGFSSLLTIPACWFIAVFALSYIGVEISERKLQKQLQNLPPLSGMFAEINEKLNLLSDWEQKFISDMNKKNAEKSGFITTKASIKQLNIVGQIYVERIRGAKLKGRDYELEVTDSDTGEIRTLTVGNSK